MVGRLFWITRRVEFGVAALRVTCVGLVALVALGLVALVALVALGLVALGLVALVALGLVAGCASYWVFRKCAHARTMEIASASI